MNYFKIQGIFKIIVHIDFHFQNEFRSSSSVHVQLQRHLMESYEPGVVVVVVVDDEPGGGSKNVSKENQISSEIMKVVMVGVWLYHLSNAAHVTQRHMNISHREVWWLCST